MQGLELDWKILGLRPRDDLFDVFSDTSQLDRSARTIRQETSAFDKIHAIPLRRVAGKVLTWPAQRCGNSGAHRIVANTSDYGSAPLARFKQGFYDVTADSDQYVGPISHQSGS